MTAQRGRILALATYPGTAASTRFRVLAMEPYLRERGWEVHFEPFITDEFFEGFYYEGRALYKARYIAARALQRLGLVFRAGRFDGVFIQREAAMIGPPYVEFLLRTLRGLPIVFDFDDALWEHDVSRSRHPIAARMLKDPNKCWYAMRHAVGVIAGSQYLSRRAAEVNARVTVAPTVVSSKRWTPLPGRLEGRLNKSRPPRIGWVGTHSTAHQLQLVESALRQLRNEGHEFEVHVVGAGADFRLDTLELQTRPWRLAREIDEFREIDIGLAPMGRGPEYEGKCAFKQIQYMAVGVPFVTSWVGGARDFIVDGQNGLVARDSTAWYQSLKALLESEQLRARLARNGRRDVEERYSTEVQGPRVASFVERSILGASTEPEAR